MPPSNEDEAEQLEQLAEQYRSAMRAQEAGDLDRSIDVLLSIVKVEPRLPEPHLSLGRLYLDSGQRARAEERTRQGLELLAETGPWTADLDPDVVNAIAHAQLAEILRQIADEDDVIFGDPERFATLIKESQEHFKTAAELDPSDETSSFYAFFMGPPAS